MIHVPQLKLYAVRVTKVERLADARDVPYRRVSHAMVVQMSRPSYERVVGRHTEGEMIKPSSGRVERFSRVRGVLVEVDAHGTVKRQHGPTEVELVIGVGRNNEDRSKDIAVEVQTSAQIRYGDSEVFKLGCRRRSRVLIHRLSITEQVR